MLQTGEAKASAAGTTVTLYYSIKPGVPLADEEAKFFLDAVRQRAESDTRGLKAACEAATRVSE